MEAMAEKPDLSQEASTALDVFIKAAKEAADIKRENQSIKGTLVLASQIIAILVKQHGGVVDAAIWDEFCTGNEFLPYSYGNSGDGRIIIRSVTEWKANETSEIQ